MLPVKKWPEYPQPLMLQEERKSKPKSMSNETPVESRIVDEEHEDPNQELLNVEREYKESKEG